MRMYSMSAKCAQYRLRECQLQLILPSLVSVFNIVIYLFKHVKGVIYLYILLYKTSFLENRSIHLQQTLLMYQEKKFCHTRKQNKEKHCIRM